MNVSVFGLGYVGSVSAATFADDGHTVVGVDVNAAKVAMVSRRAMTRLSLSRKRTGATLWGLFQDVDDPIRYLETFTVATWHEHLRQHLERGTAWERDLETEARGFLIDGAEPRVRHLIWAAAAHQP